MEINEAALQVLLAYINKGAQDLFAHGQFKDENTIESIWPRIVKTLSAAPGLTPVDESAKQ